MVQFIPASRNIALEQLNESLGNLGAAIGSRLQARTQVPKDVASLKALGFDDQQSEALAEGPEDVRKAAIQTKTSRRGPSTPNEEQMFNELIEDGMPPEEAKIFIHSTPGGQQTLMRRHVDQKNRGFRQPINQQSIDEMALDNAQNLQQRDSQPMQPEKFPPLAPPEGFSPAETAKWRQQNQRENNKELKELRDKRKKNKGEQARYDIMRDLNYSDKLPGKEAALILDSSGNVRPTAQLLGLVNPETERFAKTLADFISNAKDSFGARVTNFDLESFMKRLPSLLNTAEGRSVIIEQMDLISQLDDIGGGAMIDALQHYGNSASFSDISKVADDLVLEKEADLVSKLQRVDKAAKQLDKMAKDPETFGNTSLWFDEEGKFVAIRKGSEEKAEQMGLKPWSRR